MPSDLKATAEPDPSCHPGEPEMSDLARELESSSLPRDSEEEPAGSASEYTNRELSWLRFNDRVLELALDVGRPLLERVKFLAIFASNLDEFFMIRVSGLRRQLSSGVLKPPPDGLSPAKQLVVIRKRLKPALRRAARCWAEDLRPKLDEAGVQILPYGNLSDKQKGLLRSHFEERIFPALTPLAFDPAHPFPHISNLSINLAVVVEDPELGERFARLKVPNALQRLLPVPSEKRPKRPVRLGLAEATQVGFVWLEEVIAANLDLLFPGLEIRAAYPFRVTRDADFEIEEDEAADLLATMQDFVDQRHFGSAVRLEVSSETPARIREILVSNLGLAPYQVFYSDVPLGLGDLQELTAVDRPKLKEPPFQPRVPGFSASGESMFSVLKRREVVLYHPYDSFAPVVDLVSEAAHDPAVLAIKQTLYRVGPSSPIVAQLMKARANGKQVSAVVELKARFDEANNIDWAQALERAGVHVVYGLMGLKTHLKACLVVRREGDGIVRYVHLATGNYNPVTARIYGDLGYFTADPDIAADVSDLFNALTGYSRKQQYRKLLVAPGTMRQELLRRIEREIACHRKTGDGHLAFKMNALVDPACIQALYRAAQAGVKVELQPRAICCLKAGVVGLSESIVVTSLVGRFLEHSRIYYFHNSGDEEILIGSADLMQRNLDGRVELLVPIQDPKLRVAVRDEILFRHLADNINTWRLGRDDEYLRAALGGAVSGRAAPSGSASTIDSQSLLLSGRSPWLVDD